jgi:cytochrome c-type biogenesis protein
MTSVSLGVALAAGFLSFITPCVLPMVPVYLASLAGSSTLEPGMRNQIHTLLHSLFFVLGMTAVFTLIGAGFGLTGFALTNYPLAVRITSGILLTALGLFLLLSHWIPALNIEKRLKPPAVRTTGYVRSFFIGAIFCLAWTPCVSPILGAILVLAMNSNTAYHGAALLAVYSLGMGIPFIVIGAVIDAARPLLKKFGPYSGTINLISGILLIAMGVLVLINKISWLQ